ncbi:glycosyltransferase family 4 protein [Acetobacter oeni]|nr:glycosyltransferase family 4 protein [Acetobacter oeni]MBB3883309.1 alpha-1,3-mannosyltransferase [Acetobacter oeni]NHO19523.1 glycosyltransferase [Acetobacter oeni]GBR00880.1 glycosyltransferase [Acetobacter oeni LMG 21952]
MKVVHIVRQFSPSVGGLEDAVLNLAVQQRNMAGVETRVITLNTVFNRKGTLAPRDSVDDVPVTRIPWCGSKRYPIAPSVILHLKQADIIHVHAIDFFFDFLALCRRTLSVPMVVSTHGGFFHSGDYSRLKEIWFNTITRASAHQYSKIIACSENDAEIFSSISGSRLITIENGINQIKFRDASSQRPCRTLISFGRFSPHKRLDLLFPLLAALRKLQPEWQLIIAGRPAELGVEDLRKMADKTGVADGVTIVSDPDDVDLREMLSTATWFASLSEHEGFGLAAVEALSAGLIPVLSNIAPFRRLTERTGVGFLAETADFDAIASEVELCQSGDPARLRYLREKAIEGARLYDWRDVAVRYVDVYRDVLGRSAGFLKGIMDDGLT